MHTYNQKTNSVEEKARMEKPNIIAYQIYKYGEHLWLSGDSEDAYNMKVKEYERHLASLKSYPLSKDMTAIWKDGQEVKEGVDFEIQNVGTSTEKRIGNDKMLVGLSYEYRTVAIPLDQNNQEREGDNP